METQELIKKVRKIEIKTRGLSNQLFSGEYHTAFKGRGMAFSEVREYQSGDDVRLIDWNVTARSGDAYIKIFEEERELTTMLLVDVSGSKVFGTGDQSKRDLITELSAVISFSAIQNNDKVGIIFFSDKVEKYIPPKKGKSHILRIIRELIEFKPESKKTDIGAALEFFTSVVKKRAIVFLMSDFISPEFNNPLRIVAKRHDLIAVKLFDDKENHLPNIGLVNILDSETGKTMWVDTSDKKTIAKFEKERSDYNSNLESLLMKNKVDIINLKTDDSYIIPLRQFFKKREGRR
ncbi:MAG: DUF58 domain-containing protein [Ignavibacteriae bacterium HGW-Ignavibacteriae-4]|nr:MAG: DUF58 domain-containing protein [Ignavibacteriae bacterium HGW-Ignavibacteriae-4]